MRPLDQMVSARGKATYAIAQYSNRTDADKHAKSLGGVGAACMKK